MRNSRFFPLFLILALAALPAPLAAKPDCTSKATAVLNGAETVAGIWHTTQNIVMIKTGGTGLIGPWKASEWTFTQSVDPNTPPPLLDALKQAVAAAANVAIPGVKATCHTDLPGGDTIRIACTGTYPLRIHADGTITPDGGDMLMGHLTPASGTTPAQITFSMVPMSPMYSGKVTGEVRSHGEIGFNLDLSAAYSYGATPRATYSLRFSILPANAEAADNLMASAHFDGFRKAHTHISTRRDGPEAVVTITLDGAPAIRAKMAGETIVFAMTDYQGCEYRSEWALNGLLLVHGVQP